jgi:uncharacterized protein YegP (UPF0339 family)
MERKRDLKADIWWSKDGWRVTVKAGNGKILAVSNKAYQAKLQCNALINMAINENQVDKDVYKDKKGEWRWRIVSKSDGMKLLRSSESYENRSDCDEMVTLIISTST